MEVKEERKNKRSTRIKLEEKKKKDNADVAEELGRHSHESKRKKRLKLRSVVYDLRRR